ncbi:hypothetical protein TNCT_297291 [Trichonephila clavata]|uniref:Uncharacterized protein n=1 Tax=Trichonephila clavata TaxID=2740835 RepID=A0A8X6GSJ4_TRICU|nr:hypothetical protein TNCT_297291 [Trichonephila clavata]
MKRTQPPAKTVPNDLQPLPIHSLMTSPPQRQCQSLLKWQSSTLDRLLGIEYVFPPVILATDYFTKSGTERKCDYS